MSSDITPAPPTPAPVGPPSNLSDDVLAQYNLMVQQLALLIQSPVRVSRVLVLLAAAIKFLSVVKGLSEPQKTDLALYAVRQVISNSSIITPELKVELLSTVDLFGDAVIGQLLAFASDTKTFIVGKLGGCNWPCKKKATVPSSVPLVHARAQTLGNYVGSTEHAALAKYMNLNIQKPFTETKLIDLLASAVTFMAYYKNLAGLEKKDMVLSVAREVISGSPNIPDDQKQALITYVDTISSQLVDLFVTFGKDISIKPKSGGCLCF